MIPPESYLLFLNHGSLLDPSGGVEPEELALVVGGGGSGVGGLLPVAVGLSRPLAGAAHEAGHG